MKSILYTVALLVVPALYAQTASSNPYTRQELYDIIIAMDKAVFNAYNNCDIETFKSYFSDDAEFYHDKGGVTVTNTTLAESVKKNLCSTPGRKVRREAVPHSLEVYPMDGYGAILTGQHLFYETTNGIEKLTGKARFTHL